MPLKTTTDRAEARLMKAALSERYVVIRGRARWDVDASVREFEGSVITTTIASLIRNAERDDRPEIAKWLRNRVVHGRDHRGAFPPDKQKEESVSA